jgi:saccharopine dehydrogenase (NAD+, L-lysine-forming)
VLADVSCAVSGPTYMLPVNTEITTWEEPVRRLHSGSGEHGNAPLEVIAIDNLPSLLPREASEGFSADLTPHLLGLSQEGGPSGPWRAAGRAFDQAIGTLEAPEGS